MTVSLLKLNPRCNAVHPIALHDDGRNIRCTLHDGHDGAHEDHSTVETTACIMAWTVEN